MRKIFASAWRRVRGIWKIERADARVTIRVRQWLAFAAFLVVLAWYLAAPSPTTVMALVALGGMILSGFLWVRVPAVHLRAERRLHYGAVQVGEELEEEIQIENPTRVPGLWVEFEDHSNIPGYTLSSVRGVDGRSSPHWRASTLCTRRGVYALGPWRLLLGDPFGIFRLTMEFPSREEVLVYPPLAALPPNWLPKGRTVGDQRLLRQPVQAETINLVSTRPYAPGDPLHRIHWRSTARHDETYVKLFEPESSSSIWLIPDLDGAQGFGEGDEGSLEKLIILTASVAAELLGERRAVGLFAPSGGQQADTVIPPQAGAGHLWEVLRGLAPLAASAQPLAATLEQAARVVSRRDLLLVLTPSLQGEWTYALKRLAGSKAGGGGAAAVLLLEAGGEERAAGVLDLLAGMNLPARTIRAIDIHPQSGSYGALQRWEFTTLGTGRAYARRKPREAGRALQGGRP